MWLQFYQNLGRAALRPVWGDTIHEGFWSLQCLCSYHPTLRDYPFFSPVHHSPSHMLEYCTYVTDTKHNKETNRHTTTTKHRDINPIETQNHHRDTKHDNVTFVLSVVCSEKARLDLLMLSCSLSPDAMAVRWRHNDGDDWEKESFMSRDQSSSAAR